MLFPLDTSPDVLTKKKKKHDSFIGFPCFVLRYPTGHFQWLSSAFEINSKLLSMVFKAPWSVAPPTLFVSPQNAQFEILTPNMMVLGGGACRRWLGREIRALIRDATNSSLMWGHSQEEGLTRHLICQCLELGLPTFQSCEESILFRPHSLCFRYSSLSRLRHHFLVSSSTSPPPGSLPWSPCPEQNKFPPVCLSHPWSVCLWYLCRSGLLGPLSM